MTATTPPLYDIGVHDDEVYGTGTPGLFALARYMLLTDSHGYRSADYCESDGTAYIYSPDEYLEESCFWDSDADDLPWYLALLTDDDWSV